MEGKEKRDKMLEQAQHCWTGSSSRGMKTLRLETNWGQGELMVLFWAGHCLAETNLERKMVIHLKKLVAASANPEMRMILVLVL